jgi:hypothetical protein
MCAYLSFYIEIWRVFVPFCYLYDMMSVLFNYMHRTRWNNNELYKNKIIFHLEIFSKLFVERTITYEFLWHILSDSKKWETILKKKKCRMCLEKQTNDKTMAKNSIKLYVFNMHSVNLMHPYKSNTIYYTKDNTNMCI